MKENIAVIGGGMVGCVQAMHLAKKGHSVSIFEKRPDPNLITYKQGKSINLAISDRGFKALRTLDLEDDIKKMALPMYGRMIHQTNGTTKEQLYGKNKQAIYSISRSILNKFLIDQARAHSNINVYFNHRCVDLKLPSNEMKFLSSDSEKIKPYTFDRIFGTDGAYSAIRSRLQKINRFDYHQHFLHHGYKELTLPAQKSGAHLISPNHLHIWPRGKHMLIALPNADGSFTCTIFLPFEGEDSFQTLTDIKQVRDFFQRQFPDVSSHFEALETQFFTHPPSALVTIECAPWHYQDKVLLLGDACHAMVPFYGQGMNCGLEDITLFHSILDTHTDWLSTFQTFSKTRKVNTDAISQLALDNFHEMCTKTADDRFLLRKKIEALLAETYPEKWLPLYSRVTFSHQPYNEAKKIGMLQDEIMDAIMELPQLEKTWNSPEVLDQVITLWNEKMDLTL